MQTEQFKKWMMVGLIIALVIVPVMGPIQGQTIRADEGQPGQGQTIRADEGQPGQEQTGEESSESPSPSPSEAPEIPSPSPLAPVQTSTPNPEPEKTPDQTETPGPTQTPDPLPTATPPSGKYVLLTPKAKYKKGKLKGIRYHKVSGKKIYRIQSYTTDTVKLELSQDTKFEVYGGKSKKEVKKKYVTVSSKGVVKCHKKGPKDEIYTLIKATSKTTQKVQYIYIVFGKKLVCHNKKTIHLYENYSEQLTFNYARSKLTFRVSDKKKAIVNKKGKITAIKKGTVYVTARVKGSLKNEIKRKIRITIEPWIVSAKDKLYDYDDMTRDLKEIKKKYANKVELMDLGESYDKRTIWCLRIGRKNASKRLFINASIHAREWLNTQILMRQTEDLLRGYRNYRKRFKNTCLYIMPMDNPDGVTIAQYGFSSIRNKKLRKICKKAGHADIWKANARGVNLNNNFPAGYKESEERNPHFMAYNGKKAGSEKEAKIMMKLVNDVKPTAVINLHSTGSILYWDFDVEDPLHEKLYEMASKIHSFNRYTMMPKTGSTSGNGGFADWIVYEKKTPSVTIETGTVPCPLPHSQYKKIYKRNYDMFLWFMTEY